VISVDILSIFRPTAFSQSKASKIKKTTKIVVKDVLYPSLATPIKRLFFCTSINTDTMLETYVV
jgi:hypothetical protein